MARKTLAVIAARGGSKGIPHKNLLDLCGKLQVVLEVELGVFPPLADPLFAVRVPRTALVDHTRLHTEINEQTRVADALVEHQVEFRLSERGCHLVLHDLHPHAAARDFIPLLYRANAAHVEP